MPITEEPYVDERTVFVRALFTILKDGEDAQAPYREAHEKAIAEASAKVARRERMRLISKKRKGMRFPGSRPWQAAGFTSRQAWLDRNREQPPHDDPDQHTEEA